MESVPSGKRIQRAHPSLLSPEDGKTATIRDLEGPHACWHTILDVQPLGLEK